MSKSSFVSS